MIFRADGSPFAHRVEASLKMRPQFDPMTQTFTSPQVVCRPALSRDTADVLEFCKGIWDGHDYIQYVWDMWLGDADGPLITAEYGGRAVGIAKISHVSRGQWWFEGLRVDPKLQGLKIGSHLHEYIDQWWLEHGDGYVRLMTSSKRVKVHHLCEKSGYHKIADVVSDYETTPLDGPADAFQLVTLGEVKPSLEFVLQCPILKMTGLMDDFWRQVRPDEFLLGEMIRTGRAFWWRGGEGLLFTWAWGNGTEDDPKVLGISLPACPMEILSEFLLDVRRLAGSRGCKFVVWVTPIHDVVRDALKTAGFHPDQDDTMFVYEKKHPVS
jgi:GNAT superfamily N-acetyltransferase